MASTEALRTWIIWGLLLGGVAVSARAVEFPAEIQGKWRTRPLNGMNPNQVWEIGKDSIKQIDPNGASSEWLAWQGSGQWNPARGENLPKFVSMRAKNNPLPNRTFSLDLETGLLWVANSTFRPSFPNNITYILERVK